MLSFTWIRGLLRHPGRLGAVVLGVALSVALLASLGGFLSSSKATMTARSVATVSVDWQVQAASTADPATVEHTVATSPGVIATEPVGYADTTGLTATTGGTTQSTGPGVVVGLPDRYRSTFPRTIRTLVGPKHGVMLTQQAAANLHAAPGDVVSIGRAGLDPVIVRVDAIVEMPTADSFFQTVGAPPGAQPQAPPDNVILLPADQWHQAFDSLGAERTDLVHTQVHARLDHRLPTDPAAAYTAALGVGHNLELRLAGSGTVGNNLAAALDSARSDALYSQVLFVFLGVPGAVLAALLTAAFAANGRARRRAEQGLLRTRGASVRTIIVLAGVETVVVGVLAGVLGIATAVVVSRVAFRTWRLGATGLQFAAWSFGAALIGLVIAALVIVWPASRDARALDVGTARRTVGRHAVPRWQRAYLDIALLAAGIVVYAITSRRGYSLVLAPEGVPTVSVSYWAFLGPALLWIGTGLLVWRLVETALRRGRRPLARALRPSAGPLAGTVAASLGRQRRLLARAAVIAALAVAFAVSTATFNATYRQQAEVDAVLTNGADVTVTRQPGGSLDPSVHTLRWTSGVRHVEPLLHRYAYVGSDLQDLYGVDATTIVGAGRLQDAYVAGGNVHDAFRRLAAQPDAVLVSAETVTDYQLNLGDRLVLRLQDSQTRAPVDVPFTYVGIVTEFPTAPRDSFLVANTGYVARSTHDAASDTLLVDTGGTNITQVAHQTRKIVGSAGKVTDIITTRRIVGSSLTAVDLNGLSRLELAFGLALAAASGGMALWLGLDERRRTFAITRALGARTRQIASFVHAEVVFVTAAALGLGVLAGWGLAHVLTKVLTGVFDPPPAGLSVPWAYLITTAAALVVGAAIASFAAIRAATRSSVEALRTH